MNIFKDFNALRSSLVTASRTTTNSFYPKSQATPSSTQIPWSTKSPYRPVTVPAYHTTGPCTSSSLIPVMEDGVPLMDSVICQAVLLNVGATKDMLVSLNSFTIKKNITKKALSRFKVFIYLTKLHWYFKSV